ncbi:MAG TPA: class I SAM-dependent methyltransferase [Gammaproteobacteria bacterium]|nr:class I SAM-dependent methyltransferase [Gammaproteobacteria bacterium]
MSIYDDHILPRLIHLVCSGKQFNEKRQSLVPMASGRVLEIGMGSGLNLPFYQDQRVERIFGLEPSRQLRSKAAMASDRIDIPVELISNGAEDIPMERHSIDTVLVTFTLCSIPEIEKALREMHRVLKPDGNLYFCEHGRAPEQNVRRWQDRLNPTWKKVAGGCNLNRNIPELIKQAGFELQKLDCQYMKGPRPMSYIFKGQASHHA